MVYKRELIRTAKDNEETKARVILQQENGRKFIDRIMFRLVLER